MNNQPHIIVFYNKLVNDRCRFFIKQMEKMNFEPKVDAIHYNDYAWFQKNCVGNSYCLFFIRDKKIFSFSVDDLSVRMDYFPDFAIFYNNDVPRTSEEWLLIKNYISSICGFEQISESDLIAAKELIQPPTKIYSETNETGYKYMPKSTVGDPNYHFRTFHLDDKDVMVYEIKKPNTDLPYTTVTRNFSLKGHTPFFTDLFICESWGVARADIAFLKKLWNFLEMENEFDLDSLMKAATEKCYPTNDGGPEPEPEVYRKEMESVIEEISDLGSVHLVPEHILNKNKQ